MQQKDFLRNDFISKPNAKRINMHRLLHESIACFSIKTGLRKNIRHFTKIQGTYFKICALYFKIYGLYFYAL